MKHKFGCRSIAVLLLIATFIGLIPCAFAAEEVEILEPVFDSTVEEPTPNKVGTPAFKWLVSIIKLNVLIQSPFKLFPACHKTGGTGDLVFLKKSVVFVYFEARHTSWRGLGGMQVHPDSSNRIPLSGQKKPH